MRSKKSVQMPVNLTGLHQSNCVFYRAFHSRVVLVWETPLIISVLTCKSSGAVMCVCSCESMDDKLLLLTSPSLSPAECGGRFKGETSGRILSPGYPFPYDNNLRCTWVVEVDSGNIIRCWSVFASNVNILYPPLSVLHRSVHYQTHKNTASEFSWDKRLYLLINL